MNNSLYKPTSNIIFAIVIYLLWVAYLSTSSYVEKHNLLIEEFDKQLAHGAMTLPLILPDNFHTQGMIQKSITSNEDWANSVRLSQLADSNELVYIYSLIQKEDKIIFTASSVSDEELETKKSTSPYFTEYDDAPAELISAFATGKVQYAEYSDKWGHFRSVFIPLETSDGFRYVSAADIEISHIESILQGTLFKKLINSFLSLLFIIPFIIVFHWQTLSSNKQLQAANQDIESVNEELRKHKDELEEAIHARTTELEDTNNQLSGALDEIAEKITELQTEVAERKKMQAHLDRLAMYDELTTLPNRMLLQKEARKLFAAARRYKHKVGFMFIDLDGFKPVNDNNGHDIGDIVLVEMSLRFTDSIREIDTVGRIGGDEFLVLLPDCKSMTDIVSVAERILLATEQPVEAVNIKEKLSVSIGISIYLGNTDTFENLISLADQAMYQAKRAGGNQYFISS